MDCILSRMKNMNCILFVNSTGIDDSTDKIIYSIFYSFLLPWLKTNFTILAVHPKSESKLYKKEENL